MQRVTSVNTLQDVQKALLEEIKATEKEDILLMQQHLTLLCKIR